MWYYGCICLQMHTKKSKSIFVLRGDSWNGMLITFMRTKRTRTTCIYAYWTFLYIFYSVSTAQRKAMSSWKMGSRESA